MLHSRGKVPAQLRHLCLDGIGRVQGVGARGLADRDDAGRAPIVGGFDVVQLGSQLGPAYIPDPHGGAVRVGADGDGGKFLRCPEQVLNDDGCVQALALHRRHSAELSRGDLHIVNLERRDDVFNGQLIIRQLVGIEPDAHGIFRAENLRLAHTRHTRQNALQVGNGIIGQVLHVHTAVFGNQGDHHQVVSCGFSDRDPPALDHLGQVRHGALQFVLHLRPGKIRIGACLEGQLDSGAARRIAVCAHVEQFVEAGHLLLDDLGDAVLHGLGRRPGVACVNGDGRRGDGGVLRDGQVVDGQAARRHDDDGDDPRENGAVQEEFRQHRAPPSVRFGGRRGRLCLLFALLVGLDFKGDGLHGDAGPHLLRTLDDHTLAGRQSLRYEPGIADRAVER